MRLARNTDPVTSHMAADKVTFANRHHQIILAVLRQCGPNGKDGISLLCALDKIQISRRLPEMEDLELVEQTGQLVRSTSGRWEREWKFVEKKDKKPYQVQ